MAIPGASGNKALSGLWFASPAQALALVTKVLESTNGNITRTAKILKVSRSTFNRWVTERQELRDVLERFTRSKGRPPK